MKGPVRVRVLVPAALGLFAAAVFAQQAETPPPANPAPKTGVPIEFVPPPMDNATYSLGIYTLKSGRLVRRLYEGALESAFTAGLNGLITKWDGNDDQGKAAPPGKYAARGYAVGALKVEGEAILGNDWVAEDENVRIKRILAIAFIGPDNGLAVLATMTGDDTALLRFSAEGKLIWRAPVNGLQADDRPWLEINGDNIFVMPKSPGSDGSVHSAGAFRIADGSASSESTSITQTVMPLPSPRKEPESEVRSAPPAPISTQLNDPSLSIRSGVGATPSAQEARVLIAESGAPGRRSAGKDNTFWTAAGLSGLVQTAQDGAILRKLEVAPGDPLPLAVSASSREDRLYLLEEKPGWQRVRGLSWVETKAEGDQQISTWQTFFERSIRPDDPGATPSAVNLTLVENPLEPGKPAKISLTAGFDAKGSYLTAADGLHLRTISKRQGLTAVRLAAVKDSTALHFFQSDGAAWDEFSIRGAEKMMSFDAGEFELKAGGEKVPEGTPPEPPDL